MYSSQLDISLKYKKLAWIIKRLGKTFLHRPSRFLSSSERFQFENWATKWSVKISAKPSSCSICKKNCSIKIQVYVRSTLSLLLSLTFLIYTFSHFFQQRPIALAQEAKDEECSDQSFHRWLWKVKENSLLMWFCRSQLLRVETFLPNFPTLKLDRWSAVALLLKR